MNAMTNHTPNNIRLVFWELTARCNLQCQHCRAEAQEDFAAGELTTEEILRVAREIREAADPIMVLTGGEPLARPDFFTIAEECVGLFSQVALATNGTLIDEEMARRIVDTGIKRVSISFDGARPETHDKFRGVPGSFQAALDGFDALKRAGMSMQANVTVTRHNLAEVEDILNMLLEHGADAFHVFMLVPVGCGAEIGEETRLSPQQTEDVLAWLCEKTFDLRGRLHIKATCAPTYYRIMRDVARRRGIDLAAGQGMHAVTRGCLAGSGVCFVSRTGEVQPCGYLPVVVGNVRETKLGDIWRDSEVFAQLRDTSLLTGKCGLCGYRKVCQGCRARAYALTGDFLAEEPDCPYVPPKAANQEVAINE
ncbi:MAG TPA: radical SAM protein [Armatimonadota bacterium]|jgi:heme b synthase